MWDLEKYLMCYCLVLLFSHMGFSWGKPRLPLPWITTESTKRARGAAGGPRDALLMEIPLQRALEKLGCMDGVGLGSEEPLVFNKWAWNIYVHLYIYIYILKMHS